MNAQRPGLGYVPAIDGLRAVAIAAVVLFHLRPGWLPGGLAGVDLFFVISGFVVTASLMRRPAEPFGALVAGFFKRRVVRIVPALVAMLLVTALASVLFIPMAAEMTMVRGTAIAAARRRREYLPRNLGRCLPGAQYRAESAPPQLDAGRRGAILSDLPVPVPPAARRDGPDDRGGGRGLGPVDPALPDAGGEGTDLQLLHDAHALLGTRGGRAALPDLRPMEARGAPRLGSDGKRRAVRCSAAGLSSTAPMGAFPMPGALPVVLASLGLIALVCLHPAGLCGEGTVAPAGALCRPDLLCALSLALAGVRAVRLDDRSRGTDPCPCRARSVLRPGKRFLASGGAAVPPRRESRIALARARHRRCRAARLRRHHLAGVPRGAGPHAEPPRSARCRPAAIRMRADAGRELVRRRDAALLDTALPDVARIGDVLHRRRFPCEPLEPGDAGLCGGDGHNGHHPDPPQLRFPALSAPMARKPACRAFYATAIAYLVRTLKPGDVLFLPSLRFPTRSLDEDGLALSTAPPPAGTEAEYLALTRRRAATGARLVIEAPIPFSAARPFAAWTGSTATIRSAAPA